MNLLGTWVGDPSDDDGVAGVPCLKNGEWDIWLGALAGKEGSLGGEGQRTELEAVSFEDDIQAMQRMRTGIGAVVPLSIKVLTESDWSK